MNTDDIKPNQEKSFVWAGQKFVFSLTELRDGTVVETSAVYEPDPEGQSWVLLANGVSVRSLGAGQS